VSAVERIGVDGRHADPDADSHHGRWEGRCDAGRTLGRRPSHSRRRAGTRRCTLDARGCQSRRLVPRYAEVVRGCLGVPSSTTPSVSIQIGSTTLLSAATGATADVMLRSMAVHPRTLAAMPATINQRPCLWLAASTSDAVRKKAFRNNSPTNSPTTLPR